MDRVSPSDPPASALLMDGLIKSPKPLMKKQAVKRHHHKHNLRHRYEFLETLGKGTYGKVKKARERSGKLVRARARGNQGVAAGVVWRHGRGGAVYGGTGHVPRGTVLAAADVGSRSRCSAAGHRRLGGAQTLVWGGCSNRIMCLLEFGPLLRLLSKGLFTLSKTARSASPLPQIRQALQLYGVSSGECLGLCARCETPNPEFEGKTLSEPPAQPTGCRLCSKRAPALLSLSSRSRLARVTR